MESTAPEGKSYFIDDVEISDLYESYGMTVKIRISVNVRSGNEIIDISADKKLGRDVYSWEYINESTIKYSKIDSH